MTSDDSANAPTGRCDPVIVCAAPTGARRSRRDHPNLPITPDEVAATAGECLDAGAAMIHIHVRDDQGRHTLDVEAYRQMIRRIVRQVGDDMVIQVTTESCGMYHPQQQMDMVRQLRPQAVSLAISELIPDAAHEPAAAQFFEWLAAQGIFTQFIFYAADQIRYFRDLLQRGLLCTNDPCVLFVLGRYAPPQPAKPQQLDPFLATGNFERAWFVCAFGEREHDCIARGLSRGGHARVGFENNIALPGGGRAARNAELVAAAYSGASALGRSLATAEQVRTLFELCLQH